MLSDCTCVGISSAANEFKCVKAYVLDSTKPLKKSNWYARLLETEILP